MSNLATRVKDFVSAYPDLYQKGKMLASAYVGSRRKQATPEQKKAYGLAIWNTYRPQIVAIPIMALCSLIAADEATYALGLHHTALYPSWSMQCDYAVNECKRIKSPDQIDFEIKQEKERNIFSEKTREDRIADSLQVYNNILPYLELRKDHPPFTHMFEAAEKKIASLR